MSDERNQKSQYIDASNGKIVYYGKEYYLNMKAINDYIFQINDKQDKEVEILESYQTDENGNFGQSGKTIRELKASGNGNVETIRYEFFKILFTVIADLDVPGANATFSETLAFNTFIENGWLVEVDAHSDNDNQ